MADNVITGASDIELFIKSDGSSRGTSGEMGRLVVDEFTVTKEEDSSLVSGLGGQLPRGFTNGDVTISFSFTIMGEDVALFEKIADSAGRSKIFSFTAQRPDENGNVVWEVALDPCKVTNEEWNASTGDAHEYSVEGIAAGMDKDGSLESGGTAWG